MISGLGIVIGIGIASWIVVMVLIRFWKITFHIHFMALWGSHHSPQSKCVYMACGYCCVEINT